MAHFPFTDLHSFKDFVSFVLMCAPALFPPREGAAPHEQWSLDMAFDGLRFGLDLSEQQGADSTVIAQCRVLLERALPFYRSDNWREGHALMKEMEKLIKQLPSQ